MKNNYKKLNGMRYPALNDLIKKANNKYELVLATAKRAREIIDGANPLIPVRINNPISIATEEIDEGLIELVNPAFDHTDKKENLELKEGAPTDQVQAAPEPQQDSSVEEPASSEEPESEDR